MEENEKQIEELRDTVLRSPYLTNDEVIRLIYKAKEYLYNKIGIPFLELEIEPIDFYMRYVTLFENVVRYIFNDAMDRFEVNNATILSAFIVENRYLYDIYNKKEIS